MPGSIDYLMQVPESFVRRVIYDFNKKWFDATPTSRWSMCGRVRVQGSRSRNLRTWAVSQLPVVGRRDSGKS